MSTLVIKNGSWTTLFKDLVLRDTFCVVTDRPEGLDPWMVVSDTHDRLAGLNLSTGAVTVLDQNRQVRRLHITVEVRE